MKGKDGDGEEEQSDEEEDDFKEQNEKRRRLENEKKINQSIRMKEMTEVRKSTISKMFKTKKNEDEDEDSEEENDDEHRHSKVTVEKTVKEVMSKNKKKFEESSEEVETEESEEASQKKEIGQVIKINKPKIQNTETVERKETRKEDHSNFEKMKLSHMILIDHAQIRTDIVVVRKDNIWKQVSMTMNQAYLLTYQTMNTRKEV